MKKIYTMEDWRRDGEFSANVGQEVDADIVIEMRDCVPPAYHSRGIVQCGEAYTHERGTLIPLYATFEADTEGNWIFCGYCREGETIPRKGWGEE